MALSTSLSVARNTDRITMGPSSPIAPTASTIVPKRVAVSPASRSTGTSTPRAVVARAIPTTSGSETTPAASRAKPIATPRTRPMAHPAPASRSGAPAMRRRSISRPARKNSAASPRFARKLTNWSGSAMSSTCGPMTMPRTISTTTVAIRARFGMSAMIGASTAAAAMITRVVRSGSTAADSQRAPGGRRRRPGISRSPRLLTRPAARRRVSHRAARVALKRPDEREKPHGDRDFVRRRW